MRTFMCRSLGNDCAWMQAARTDDLLLEKVAIHLRDAHGMPAVFPDMVGAIHRAFDGFDGPEVVEVSAESGEGDLFLKEFRCTDIGQKCNFHYVAMTEDLIADGVALHTREAHGIKEFTPDLIARVKNVLHPWRS